MNHLLTCLLALLVFLSGPAMRGNVEIWHSPLAAETGAARLGSLTPAQARQIQAFSDRFGAEVNVVGSRAAGRGLTSDFDYVIGGNSSLRHSADYYLPRGPLGTGAGGRGIDIFNANVTPLDPTRPFIRFTPGTTP